MSDTIDFSKLSQLEKNAGATMTPEELRALCEEKVCATCDKKAEADDVRMRALAEMENFKKRLQRERDEQARYATEAVLSDLLPTLDNLDLALQYGANQEACKDMLLGVEMTRKLLLDSVQRHGLEQVGVPGEAFSPEVHEAIGTDVRHDMAAGMVSKVLQRGYKLKDRLLRPAKVTVTALPEPLRGTV